MKRTNIYLDEAQVARLDQLSRARGLSRAELVRRLLDGAIDGSQAENLTDDLAAIGDSFGALREDGDFVARGPDERSRHLERIARR
jgi:hypothetical protein